MGEITLQWQSQDALGAWTDIIGANGSSILLGDEEVVNTSCAGELYRWLWYIGSYLKFFYPNH